MTHRITFMDDGPDRLGRRRFMVEWEDPGNCWIPEPSKTDGAAVGHRRGQVFFTQPGPFMDMRTAEDSAIARAAADDAVGQDAEAIATDEQARKGGAS